MLSKIHSSHLGIGKCKRRARDVLFWPGMNQQVTDMISKCNTCNTYRNAQAREPLKSHDFDIFELDKQDYVVIVDYYSKFFEVSHLPNSKSKTVINHIKSHLARYGIPEKAKAENKDFHLALLDYRNTPMEEINLSPAQVLMGRQTRT